MARREALRVPRERQPSPDIFQWDPKFFPPNPNLGLTAGTIPFDASERIAFPNGCTSEYFTRITRTNHISAMLGDYEYIKREGVFHDEHIGCFIRAHLYRPESKHRSGFRITGVDMRVEYGPEQWDSMMAVQLVRRNHEQRESIPTVSLSYLLTLPC